MDEAPLDGPSARWQKVIAGVMALLALALGLLASRGELWLDEIWALDNVRSLESPLDVLTAIHSDGNHYLTSLYLMLVGDEAPYALYRLPSVLAGALTTLLVSWPPISRRPPEALLAGLLLALSPLMVQYNSEARGYSLAALCAVGSYRCFARLSTSPVWGPVFAFALVASLGLLAHLTFVYALLGFAAWGGAEMYRSWKLEPRLLMALGLPLAVFAVLWAVDLRLAVTAGGKAESLSEVLNAWAAALLGLPHLGAWIVLALAGVALSGELEQAGEGTPWVFFAVTIVVAPALFVVALRPVYLAPRYFFLGAPFLLLLVARGLVRLAEMGPLALRLAIGIILLIAVGSAWRDGDLIRLGRGDYARVIAFMSEHTSGPTVSVGSDHDLRNAKVLSWYERRLPGLKPIEYQSSSDTADELPEWFLVHDPPEGMDLAERRGADGERYLLALHAAHAGLSGWDWYLYRREPR